MENGPLSEKVCRVIFGKILDSLTIIHQKKIVHRDFNPKNIFIKKRDDNKYEIKVLDFNVSKLFKEEEL